MTVSDASFRLKDAAQWSRAEVREFIGSVLPGHPCVDFFTYTTGYVLCSLEREDLRRQAKDEEAANVIWHELRKCTQAAPPKADAQDKGLDGTTVPLEVYVKTQRGDVFDLRVQLSDTVAMLKARLAESEGTPPESQRLMWKGFNMHDERTLASYEMRHGAVVLLAPKLRDWAESKTRRAQFVAPRGQLATTHVPWSPNSTGSVLPVLCRDVSRDFPVGLEFAGQEDCDAFAAACREEQPPVLEIPSASLGAPVTECRVFLDPDTGGVELEGGTSVLKPNSRYDAYLHFGGRGGSVRVALETGSVAPL